MTNHADATLIISEAVAAAKDAIWEGALCSGALELAEPFAADVEAAEEGLGRPLDRTEQTHYIRAYRATLRMLDCGREDIVELAAEAVEAGDDELAQDCRAALDGCARAWGRCAVVIDEGHAQDEDGTTPDLEAEGWAADLEASQ